MGWTHHELKSLKLCLLLFSYTDHLFTYSVELLDWRKCLMRLGKTFLFLPSWVFWKNIIIEPCQRKYIFLPKTFLRTRIFPTRVG
ncbi:mCG1039061 [Mus musculus]|nr:mCG1039061 [Mus musculus]